MELFGLTIARQKALPATLSPVARQPWGGFWNVIRESFPGAWQQNVEVRLDNALTYFAIFSCITLIASDIGKLRIKLVQKDGDGIWSETESPAFSPVLRKPNRYQTRIKFIEQWIVSKLVHGNTYVLKERDDRGVVVKLYILDPQRVTPLVAPDGSVYYQLNQDDLSGVSGANVVVPAREIIHDMMVALCHPLVGVSPISACGLAAVQGLRIQNNSALFFGNASNPGGILTAPGLIDDETANRIKRDWEEKFSGPNVGKVAVLGDGLKYEPMAVSPVDAQLIEQLKWTAETACSCFHVPGYMVGIGPAPTYNNIEALNQQYYSQCLQTHIESIELLLDEGLELPKPYGTEFDLDELLRMDTASKIKAAIDGIGGGLFAPDEARKPFGLKPVRGGSTPYMQQQNFSLAALDARDRASPAPSSAAAAPASPQPPAPKIANDNQAGKQARLALREIRKGFA